MYLHAALQIQTDLRFLSVGFIGESSFLNNPIIPIFAKALTLAENTAFGKS